ncbi:MAG: cation:proton antiporter [Methanomassiliicoccaceae archaeon]|nr:cation:proton antiporter [Methanomassiliicoccaceae archaeon]
MTVAMEQVMIILCVLFTLAFFASAVFKRFGVPGLIGEIFVGIFVANLVIGDWSLLGFLHIERPIPGVAGSGNENWNMIEMIAELGIVFLLFVVGMETKVKDLTSVGRTAMLVAVLGVAIPFVAGYALMMAWDGNIYHAMFMGAAMVATSIGITAQAIKDMKMMSKKESRIIIGAAVIDDIIGLIVLAVVAGMAMTGSVDYIDITEMMIISVMFVALILLFCAKAVPKIACKILGSCEKRRTKDPGWRSNIDIFVVAIIVCLLLSTLAYQMRLAMIIGAFLAGMIFADYAHDAGLTKKMESLTAFFLPFFFVYVGLHIDLSSFTASLLLLAAIVIVLAFVTKYVGCGLGVILGGKEKISPHIVGTGMVPRGEVGIIVATIGIGIIVAGEPALTNDLFAVIVLMAVVTTLIAPFMLSSAYKKKYGGREPEDEPRDDCPCEDR